MFQLKIATAFDVPLQTMRFRDRPYATIALITSIIAALGDFVVTTLIGLHYKDYNSLTDSQSDLGTYNSPVALYMNTWEVILGLLLLTCTWCLYKTGFFKLRLQKLALILLAIYAIGEGIGSGLFPFNHINGELTSKGWVHSIFSGFGITSMVLLSFLVVNLFSNKQSPRLKLLFLFYAVMGAVFILFCLLSRGNFLHQVGLWQRLYLLAYYAMLITLTMHVYRNASIHAVTKAKLH
ncbi:MAG: DUF998 domain-containing protein [Flavisolibacter sp.]